MAKSLDKTTTLRAQAIFAEWSERPADRRVAPDRAGVSERTGRRWRLRIASPDKGAKPSREAKTNMAFEPTRFVGRQPALAELRGLFARGGRLRARVAAASDAATSRRRARCRTSAAPSRSSSVFP